MSSNREQITSALSERMGLGHDPFGAAVDGFFFVGGQRRFLVQQAVHALYFASGIVLLSGAKGAGKTRIVDEVCRELAELVDICRLDASVLMDINGVRQHLADSLGLTIDAADEGSLLAALEQLQPETGDPLPILLAIDDAEQLAVPVLSGCHQLAGASGGRIRLLLSGAPEMLTAWEQVGDFSVDQLDVLPLDAQEAADYVSTCLQAAGYRGENPLSEAGQQDFYRQTRGNIAAIHDLAPSVLLAAVGGGELAEGRRGLPLPHLAIVAGLVVIVGITTWLWRGSKSDEAAPAPTEPIASEASAKSAVTADGRTAVSLAVPTVTAPQPAESAPVEAAPSRLATTAPAPVPSQVQAVALPATESPVAKPSPVEPISKAPTPTPKAAAPVTPPARSSIPKIQPEAPVTAKAAAPQKPAEPAKPAAATNTLATLPAKQFVLQLIAADSKPGRDKFLSVSAKGVKVYTYEARRDGKPRYLAVIGPYADLNAARAAIAGLPKPLRDQNPWPRSVASVQADLNAK